MAVDPACSPEPDPEADARVAAWLGPPRPDDAPDLLHVGTTIPRKRIDVLLRAFAGVRRALPAARLIKAGGALNPEQTRLAAELGVAEAIVSLPFLDDRATLAAVYRRAALVMLPSDAEGFGLPAPEALACGTPVLLSDIPAFREVGGEPASYAPPGDPDAWSEAALGLLDQRLRDAPAWHARRAGGLEWASRYRWPAHVERLVALYRTVLGA
jgi:glycosyltransferase involved in cell wall biosynthesis